MKSTNHYIELKKGRICAHCFGRGEELLIALHGYGDSGRVFEALAPALSDRFRVYAVDLPFHGATEWEAPEYDAGDLEALVGAILTREAKTRFQWLGYSYGGRLILSTLGCFAGRLSYAYLVAPDGLGTRGMRLPLLFPPALRRRLAARLERPRGLLLLIGWLRRSALLSSFSDAFLRRQLVNEQRRRRLAGTWRSLPHFPVRLPEVRRQLTGSDLKMCFFAGSADELIAPERIRAISTTLPGAGFQLLPGGHYELITPELGRRIAGGTAERQNGGTSTCR